MKPRGSRAPEACRCRFLQVVPGPRKHTDELAERCANDWADPRVSVTVWLTPCLVKVTAARVPGWRERTASSRAVALTICWLADRMVTSPGRRPGRAAGPARLTRRGRATPPPGAW